MHLLAAIFGVLMVVTGTSATLGSSLMVVVGVPQARRFFAGSIAVLAGGVLLVMGAAS